MDESPNQISEILEARNSVVTANQKRAAAYVRMSTEHQRYSIRHQMIVIEAYALLHGIEITRTYEDAGKSGLSLKGRRGLLELLSDVIDGTNEFSHILVQDISRWGRFQDADEAAYYEHVCRRAGYAVHYVDEQFDNNNSPVSSIMKSIKRAMAGEYSRELSRKVFVSQCNLARRGYWQSGSAGFGLRRMVVDEAGNHKGLLQVGEYKFVRGHRVTLVKGPPGEVRIVRRIYREFIENRSGETEIADGLNKDGILNSYGRPWVHATIKRILKSEKYIGNNVFNQTAYKMQSKRVKNPPEEWIRKEGAFEHVVDKKTFDAAQEIYRARARHYTPEELLSGLRKLYRQHGYLNQRLVKDEPGTPAISTYYDRFGSLVRAFELVGYVPDRNYEHLRYKKRVRELKYQSIDEVADGFVAAGADVKRDGQTGLFRINSEFTVGVMVAPRRNNDSGHPRWKFNFTFIERPDIAVGVRMDLNNENVLDYFVLPAKRFVQNTLFLSPDNRMALSAFHTTNLCPLYKLASRQQIEHWVFPEAATYQISKYPRQRKIADLQPSRNLTWEAERMFAAYNRNTQVIRELTGNAESAKHRSDAIAGTLSNLFCDENFANLLRAERLDSMPDYLAGKIDRQSRQL